MCSALRPGVSAEQQLLVGDAAPRRPRHKPPIKPLPPSGLLGKLQAFLPTLEAANADLEQQLASGAQAEVAMERGSDDEREGPVVEMDLACGLFELKDASAVAAAEASMLSRGVAVEKYGGNSTDSSSSSDDSGSSSEDEEGEAGAALRQVLGGGAAAAAAMQTDPGSGTAAAGGDKVGGDAMEEGGDAAANGAADTGAEAEAGTQAGAAPGRRRRQKKRGGRHAGIVELS